jgi:hypothetical protein
MGFKVVSYYFLCCSNHLHHGHAVLTTHMDASDLQLHHQASHAEKCKASRTKTLALVSITLVIFLLGKESCAVA